MSKKPETNTELINQLMEFGPHGAMQQIVIVEAIRHYTREFIKQGRPETPGTGFVNQQAVYDTCVYIKAEMDKFYGRNAPAPAREAFIDRP